MIQGKWKFSILKSELKTMPTIDELLSMIESLNRVVKAQSNRLDAQDEVLEVFNKQLNLLSDSYLAFSKDAPSIELIAKLRESDAKTFEELRDKTVSAFNLCNSRIGLSNSINNLLIEKIGKLLNEEEKKKLASEVKQKYNEMIAGLLNDDSISEESKIDFKKITESGFPMFIVR